MTSQRLRGRRSLMAEKMIERRVAVMTRMICVRGVGWDSVHMIPRDIRSSNGKYEKISTKNMRTVVIAGSWLISLSQLVLRNGNAAF
jgi:hypothetical protein